jgi:hypothetical protein
VSGEESVILYGIISPAGQKKELAPPLATELEPGLVA